MRYSQRRIFEAYHGGSTRKKEKSEDVNEKYESLKDCGKLKDYKSVSEEFNKFNHHCKEFKKERSR